MIQNLILTTTPWFLVKVAVLILLFMYLIFALIVVRQVKLMTTTIQIGYESFIAFLAYAHLIFSVIVIVAALIIL